MHRKGVRRLQAILLSRWISGPFITISIVCFLELIARLMLATFFLESWAKVDLRTKLEKVYVPAIAEKRPNALRVFVYGGSTVAGFPLPKTGFVSQLDYQLHHIFGETQDVEVYNLGRNGFNSTLTRYMVVSTIESQPDLLIIYMGHNEFVAPEIDTLGLHRLLSRLRDQSSLVRLVLLSLHARPTAIEGDEPIDRKRWPYRLIETYYRLKLLIFHRNMRAIIALAQQRNIPILLITPASNIKDWPPAREHVTTLPASPKLEGIIAEATALVERGSSESARTVVANYRHLFPLSPTLIYLEGLLKLQAGEDNRAESLFNQARDRDLIPLRATSEIIDFIRKLHDGKTVWVVDASEQLNSSSPHRIAGYEYFYDNVHPNPRGSYRIVEAILATLRAKRLVKPDWWEKTLPPYTLEQFFARINLSQEEQLQALLVPAGYCLRNPFFYYACTEMYLKEAETIAPSDWRILAMRASMAYLRRDEVLAKSYRDKAITAQTTRPTREEFLQIPYFLEVMQQ